MGNILQNRTFKTNGWMDAKDKFNKYPSVEMADYFDTSSSAGDWNGYVVQRINRYYYIIPFSQSNNYPYYGYTIQTAKPIVRLDHKPTAEMVWEYIEELW